MTPRGDDRPCRATIASNRRAPGLPPIPFVGALCTAALLSVSACANIWGFDDLGNTAGGGGSGGTGAGSGGGGSGIAGSGAAGGGAGGSAAAGGGAGESGAGGSGVAGRAGETGAGGILIADGSSSGQVGSEAATKGSGGASIEDGGADTSVEDGSGGQPESGVVDVGVSAEADAARGAGDAAREAGANADAGVCIATPRELLVNGSFEQGETGWMVSVAGGFPIVYAATGSGNNSPDVVAQSPPNVTWIGGYNRADDSIAQIVMLPADATSMTLTFYYAIVSRETVAVENDVMDVQLIAGAQTLAVAHFNNIDPIATWTRFSMALPSRLAGQAVTLRFHGTTNAAAITSFYIDTISVQAVVCQ